MKVTMVEISRRPVHPQTIYVMFDRIEDAQKFVEDVNEDFEFSLDRMYEEDEKKFAYPFGRDRELFGNITLDQLKQKLFGTGWC